MFSFSLHLNIDAHHTTDGYSYYLWQTNGTETDNWTADHLTVAVAMVTVASVTATAWTLLHGYLNEAALAELLLPRTKQASHPGLVSLRYSQQPGGSAKAQNLETDQMWQQSVPHSSELPFGLSPSPT